MPGMGPNGAASAHLPQYNPMMRMPPMFHPMMPMQPMIQGLSYPQGYAPMPMPVFPGQFPMVDHQMMMMGYMDPARFVQKNKNGKKTGK